MDYGDGARDLLFGERMSVSLGLAPEHSDSNEK